MPLNRKTRISGAPIRWLAKLIIPVDWSGESSEWGGRVRPALPNGALGAFGIPVPNNRSSI